MKYRQMLIMGALAAAVTGCYENDDNAQQKCGNTVCVAPAICIANVGCVIPDQCVNKVCQVGTCNPISGLCEGSTVNLCIGKVCPGSVCNPSTGQCNPVTDKCLGISCPGSTCNPQTGLCNPLNDKCAGISCPGSECDSTTGQCLNENNKCIGVVCTNSTCNPNTGTCYEVTDKCAGISCPGSVCNPSTGLCNPVTDKCAGVPCPGSSCNPETGTCYPVTDKCAGVPCPGSSCNPETGTCYPVTDKCAGVSCPGSTCNPDTGTCNPIDKCANKICDNGTCNPQTGLCEEDPDGCTNNSDCNNPQYESCVSGQCVYTACIGVTCESWQSCGAVSGNCVNYPGRCSTKEDCDQETQECSSNNECVSTCEAQSIDNIVPNWSFEEWENNEPKYWSIDKADGGQAQARISKSSNAAGCKTAIALYNTSSGTNVRLESDPIYLTDPDIVGQAEYNCSVKVSGTGYFNLGYRKVYKDFETGEVTEDKSPKYEKSARLENNDYSTYTFGFKAFRNPYETDAQKKYVSAVKMVVAFRETTSDKGIVVDEFSCVPTANQCTGKTCEDWQICTTASYGTCIARKAEGYCMKDGDCPTADMTCNTTTHTCKRKDGGCLTHEDCASSANKKCDFTQHVCVSGDPCDGVTCKESWKECKVGKCVLKANRCIKSSDCNNKDLPLCDVKGMVGTDHQCVGIDSRYTVSGKLDCPLTGYDKNSKTCPLNIVPNGGFEEWEEVSLYEGSLKYYNLPVSWYGLSFDIGPTLFATEIDPNLVKPYTSNTHSGSKALQIQFTKQPADRFTSEGFNVPGGSIDCSYWVRGKGDIRIHSFSSRGEDSKSNFQIIDSTEWTRVPFKIRDAASAMRLIFYVSNTDASKDHIQIDDVVCSTYTY